MAYPNPYVPNMSLRTPASMDARLTRMPTAQQMEDRNIGVQPPTGGNFNWGGVAQAGLAGAQMVMNTVNMANEGLGIDTSVGGTQYSATGQPIYDPSLMLQTRASRPQGVKAGEVLGATATGAAIGSQIMPGIGTAVGAAAGLLSSTIGGLVRGRRQRRQKDRAEKLARFQQEQFNEASQSFDEQQAAQTDYIRRRNMTNRLYNLYSIPS